MPATYQSVVEEAASLAGLDLANLSTHEVTFFNRAINRRVRFAWDWWWWAPAMRIEQRFYRPVFNPATAYTLGAEVVYDYAYYILTAASSTGNLPTDTDYWSPIPDLDAYIPLDQADETPIGTVRTVWTAHPTTGYAQKLAFRITTRGIEFFSSLSVVPSVWVEFKTVLPAWTGAVWSNGATYAADTVVLFPGTTLGYEGDYYTCVSVTTAGQSPLTHPAKWSKVEFPDYLARAVAFGAYSDWLRAERRPDEAQAEEGQMYNLLQREKDNYPADRR
jgi:hypothetical protein